MEEHKTKIIMLTKVEAFYLDDVFTLLTVPDREFGMPVGLRPTGQSALLAVPPDLIDRIGMVILLTTSEDGIEEAPLEVDDNDLYMIREVANTGLTISDEPVGLSLKKKVYSALLGGSFEDSLKFAKLMQDMEVDSSASRNKAQKNLGYKT